MPEPTHSAFISYCRDDQEFALRLAQDLKDAGAAVWLDQLDIKPGHPWDNAVEDALRDATKMLVILTPTSVASENVRDEIAYALRQGKIVIPVLYMECTIPLRLERKQHIDFRANYARGLELLLRELRVENPDTTVLEKAAEGDAQRQLAWQARDAEANRLDELRQQEQAEALRLDELKRQEQAEVDRLKAAQEQEQAEVARRAQEAEAHRQREFEQQLAREAEAARLAREAEAQRQRELEQQQAKDAEAARLARESEAHRQREFEQQQAKEAAERLAAQEAAQRRQQAAAPPPPKENVRTETSATSVPVKPKRKILWIGLTTASVLILGVALFHKTPPPESATTPSKPTITSTTTSSDADDAADTAASAALAKKADAFVAKKLYTQALPLYEQACNAGYSTACNSLGLMYDNHQGVAQDYARAAELYEEACDDDVPSGCSNLGAMYDEGTGVTQDYGKAFSLETEACDDRSPEGCSILGKLYDLGHGTAADPVRARQYLQKGCSLGNTWGCNYLKKMK